MEEGFRIDDMQKVDSAYTKDRNPVGFLKNSEVMYVEKERSHSLLRAIGFQMPIKLSDSSFIGSISYEGRFVKLSGKKIRKVFRRAD